MKSLRPDADRRRPSPMLLLLAASALGLLLVAVWFRCRSLENLPGINGDEAWYGVKTLQLLWGQQLDLRTPTGNPLSPFFIGPLLLLHVFFSPSITLLRSVAMLSGLAALLVNWLLCRWVFDRRTAVISTLALAVLPINIAYSRFAWDASQSLLVTLPVLYFSLAAVRFSQHRSRFVTVAVLVQIAAVLVHPTNIFAGAAIAVAMASRLRPEKLKRIVAGGTINRRMIVSTVLIAVVLLGSAVYMMGKGSPRLSRFTRRMGGVSELIHPQASLNYAVLYPRLFIGGTVYRDIAGSRSWWEWPLAEDAEGWGTDVLLFWGIIAAAAWFAWRSWKMQRRVEDCVLIAVWALELIAFLLLTGPRSMSHGWQRYAVCLVAPTVVLASRGVALCCDGLSRRPALRAGWPVLVVASLAGWLVLADFNAHYFKFIQQTGGRGHRTFRTAAIEPKQAVLQHILQHRQTQPMTDGQTTWIVASEWWNHMPLKYLAMAEKDIRVVEPKETAGLAQFEFALRQGRVWYVEFSGSEGLDAAEARLDGREVQRKDFPSFGGRPLLTLLHGP